MMANTKNTIDSWNSNLYDNKHAFVSEYGTSLVELLNAKNGERVLDLGCGTGDLAHKLYEQGVKIVAVDKSENMVEQANRKYPHINFLVQDATELDYDHEFDAVFSNATLHWVKPPIQALHGIYKSLKQGGRFIAEFGGKDNIKTIAVETIKQIKEAGYSYKEEQFPWFFPSIAEYSTLMEEVGFRVTFAEHYNRPTQLEGNHGLKNWIEMFCVSLFDGISEVAKNEIISKVEHNVRATLHIDGHWYADYKRIRVTAIKP